MGWYPDPPQLSFGEPISIEALNRAFYELARLCRLEVDSDQLELDITAGGPVLRSKAPKVIRIKIIGPATTVGGGRTVYSNEYEWVQVYPTTSDGGFEVLSGGMAGGSTANNGTNPAREMNGRTDVIAGYICDAKRSDTGDFYEFVYGTTGDGAGCDGCVEVVTGVDCVAGNLVVETKFIRCVTVSDIPCGEPIGGGPIGGGPVGAPPTDDKPPEDSPPPEQRIASSFSSTSLSGGGIKATLTPIGGPPIGGQYAVGLAEYLYSLVAATDIAVTQPVGDISLASSAGTWDDVTSTSLPAGVYEARAIVNAAQVNISAGTTGFISGRFYNSTGTAVLLGPYKLVEVDATGTSRIAGLTIIGRFTLSVTSTVKFQAKRDGTGSPTFTTSLIMNDGTEDNVTVSFYKIRD